MLRRLVASVVAAGVLAAPASGTAHYYEGCRGQDCKRHVIKPYIRSFLLPVGTCESARGTWSLKKGLRAISPAGKYRGRYQFGMPDWRRAGGTGDPIDADWLTQAYIAVKWLHINGRDSWPNC